MFLRKSKKIPFDEKSWKDTNLNRNEWTVNFKKMPVIRGHFSKFQSKDVSRYFVVFYLTCVLIFVHLQLREEQEIRPKRLKVLVDRQIVL